MADNKAMLGKLYKKYNLTSNDIFKSPQGWVIIKREGIDKIQSVENIDIRYELITYDIVNDCAAVKAVGVKGDARIETFGEAAPKNCKQAYKLAMAEKRAMSRVVLKLSGFYELGVYGQDEADDFAKVPKKDRKSIVDLVEETL